ncbi:hypothetical protein D5S17_11770 [Pseudonocardiaceae bacterium YIM PH 21723]|nr:hypothetical protein D5S17_11770 [Pseudonocardiaceae bacterium YIM PH 21723]
MRDVESAGRGWLKMTPQEEPPPPAPRRGRRALPEEAERGGRWRRRPEPATEPEPRRRRPEPEPERARLPEPEPDRTTNLNRRGRRERPEPAPDRTPSTRWPRPEPPDAMTRPTEELLDPARQSWRVGRHAQPGPTTAVPRTPPRGMPAQPPVPPPPAPMPPPAPPTPARGIEMGDTAVRLAAAQAAAKAARMPPAPPEPETEPDLDEPPLPVEMRGLLRREQQPEPPTERRAPRAPEPPAPPRQPADAYDYFRPAQEREEIVEERYSEAPTRRARREEQPTAYEPYSKLRQQAEEVTRYAERRRAPEPELYETGAHRIPEPAYDDYQMPRRGQYTEERREARDYADYTEFTGRKQDRLVERERREERDYAVDRGMERGWKEKDSFWGEEPEERSRRSVSDSLVDLEPVSAGPRSRSKPGSGLGGRTKIVAYAVGIAAGLTLVYGVASIVKAQSAGNETPDDPGRTVVNQPPKKQTPGNLNRGATGGSTPSNTGQSNPAQDPGQANLPQDCSVQAWWNCTKT